MLAISVACGVLYLEIPDQQVPHRSVRQPFKRQGKGQVTPYPDSVFSGAATAAVRTTREFAALWQPATVRLLQAAVGDAAS